MNLIEVYYEVLKNEKLIREDKIIFETWTPELWKRFQGLLKETRQYKENLSDELAKKIILVIKEIITNSREKERVGCNT